jgi:hypothetical protein
MTNQIQRKFMLGGAAALALTVFMGHAPSASAATIVMQGASSINFNTMGEFVDSDGVLAASRTIDQGGLNIKYNQGGLDDQAAYLARAPKHTDSTSQEWFSRNNTSFGLISFDLGASYDLRNLVLWNEDFAGIEKFSVLTSNAADLSDRSDADLLNFLLTTPLTATFTANGVGVSPVGTPASFIEPAQVFSLSSSDAGVNARYVTLFISSVLANDVEGNRDVDFRGNQRRLGSLASIGEIAFGRNLRAGEVAVPTPALLPGLIGLGATAWRKRRQLAAK